MNNTVKFLVIFAAGVGVGALTSKVLLEKKYKEIADEEIASVKEAYTESVNDIMDKYEERAEKEVVIATESKYEEKGDISEYTNIVSDEKYTIKNDVFVISPEEFGEADDYKKVYLTYYSGDDYLADEYDKLVENVDESIGWEALNHFGDYEADIVHVRNDANKCYYEITKDLRNYKDVADVQED